MKKRVTLILVFLLGLSMVLPSAGYSWSRGYHGHRGYYGGSGWGAAAAALGGLIAGLFVGSILADQPARSNPPPPPPPGDVIIIDQAAPDAAPAPTSVAKQGEEASQKPAPGEWVTVPGQTVDGLWVPEHEVWVPQAPVVH
jgi:hypothetical protein